MMRKIWITLIAALLLGGIWGLSAAGGTACDGIIVNDADNVRCLTSAPDSGLAGFINSLTSRIAIHYADGNRE